MSIDGSFTLHAALQRFLNRCEELKCTPQFDSLLIEGETLTEEEVIKSLAVVFFHPKYTIPLIGCFRPIAQKIVDKAVGLLRDVHCLGSNSDDGMEVCGEEYFLDSAEKDKVIDVVLYFDQRGRGLDIHELACLAFSRALELAPFLLGSITNYFKFSPPPFQRVLNKGSVTHLSSEVVSALLLSVRTSYRFLMKEPDFFFRFWDWSCFLDLVHQFVEDLGSRISNLEESVADIRWCGMQILSVILRMRGAANENFGVGSQKEALKCLKRWEEFCQDVSLEKVSCYHVLSENISFDPVNSNSAAFNEEICLESLALPSLSMLHFEESEPSTRRRRLYRNDDLSTTPFVLTSNVKKSYEMVLLAVSQKWPVLLYGPAGVGKSTLVSKLARDTRNRVLSIHMDDQLDGKTLVGSFVSTEQPGEFKWQPGSLTQAVMNGFWVVFEDIDKAPPDVQSILLPLLEGASSFSTSHGEEVRVAESFRLFSTISSTKLDACCGKGGGYSLGILWRRIMVLPPGNEDMHNILKAWYPNLEHLSGKLIETYCKVNSVFLQLTGYQSPVAASYGSFERFSIRDLLKWCKRISCLEFSMMGVSLSNYERHRVYQEAVDIFAAFSTSIDKRLSIMKEIAKLWGIADSMTESLYPHDKPIIQDLHSELRIGRVTLQRSRSMSRDGKKALVCIRSSMHLLERISCSIKFSEPVLLVGETGTGKTTLVQNLAMRLGQKLTVLNLSQQSDVTDLLGGFKPMDAQYICIPLYREFEELFSSTVSVKGNHEFFGRLHEHMKEKNWKKLLVGIQKGVKVCSKKLMAAEDSGSGQKRRKTSYVEKQKAWDNFTAKLDSARAQIGSSGMIFSFVEGAFVSALRNGEWILLDEVNLAPPETLQRILGVLEGEHGSLCLAERGDVNDVHRHTNFRLFACMNPATDAGKRDLPHSLRSRFTEYFVDDVLDDGDLTLFVNQFIDERKSSDRELVKRIVSFYKTAKKESDDRLQDGANQKPQYSLRSLYRALEYKRKAERNFGLHKAIYDGFSMFFLTLLDGQSAKIMNQMILSWLLEGKMPAHVPFHNYLINKTVAEVPKSEIDFKEHYVLTKSVKEHLCNLARSIFIERYPVLLQGPTSSGKTSLVRYLAAITGHKFIRINNHEHTDLQEYLGSYITDTCGKLVFREGVLVEAVRKGYWVVLDELNLAPSDVLEALNRLLDDNRELYVPELCETVRANPNFMLFATQNPPTSYGGRKMLSRAFRNRFVEIHVDEIPQDELSTILELRCRIPASRAAKMVEVMRELQLRRQKSKVFAGKHGFITPRDLFRWAKRSRDSVDSYELAKDGYYLLAERLCDEDEKRVVEEVLEKHFRVKLLKNDLYNKDLVGGELSSRLSDCTGTPESLRNVTCTQSMWRLYFLVRRCYEMNEPVLLIGETGGGKTTVCQILNEVLRSEGVGSTLHILNCHQYTETADFIGGFYPIRQRSELMSEYTSEINQLTLSKFFINYSGDMTISPNIGQAPLTLDKLARIIDSCSACSDVTKEDIDAFCAKKDTVAQLYQKWQTIFTWQDGPLVEAMRTNGLFLVDEISLADDSVLERLNSVLEPERILSLAEKGGSSLETVTAGEGFLVLATMNPGGDYGKKELSPALRNRFTEIWVPSVDDLDELKEIALKRFSTLQDSYIVDVMLKFWKWFNELQIGRILTVRDLLSWVDFFNSTRGSLGPEFSLLHGAFLVVLDGLTLGTGISKTEAVDLRERCFIFILNELQMENPGLDYLKLSKLENYGWTDIQITTEVLFNDSMQCDNAFGIDPFYIEKGMFVGDNDSEVGRFKFLAPTTRRNALRVLRAMQLSKPVLLEGSPGVGKTSLVTALGKFSGNRVVRINLSEQTDMMDLLGSDLPVESDEGMKFAWSDGILLQALKEGCWVLLDELNLAPQSVLEGMNAILDHRAEVFIPELGRTFKCPPSFRVFACQNPSHQGGGRKGLPKSFLNRFTKVYVDELAEDDYLSICVELYPSISEQLLSKLILFNKRLHEDTMLYRKFAQDGSPWEFNLRDVIRSCQIIQGVPDNLKVDCFLDVLYVQRMRSVADRKEVIRIYEEVFETKPFINPFPQLHLNSQNLLVGNAAIKRNFFHASKFPRSQLQILPGIRQSLEAAVRCIQHQWMCILVGPPGSGKTSLVRLLSQLTGNALNELNLSAATDVSELIGCFEQYNVLRKLRFVVARVEHYINEYCDLQWVSSNEIFVREKKELISKWLKLLSCVERSFAPDSGSALLEQWNSIFDSLGLLVEIMEQIKYSLEKSMLSKSSTDLPSQELWSGKELNRIVNMIITLQNDHKKQRQASAKFEWVTGSLIRAIEYGEWIVLEDANLCNPTVLDRINSLVESYGSITLNECGTVDGKPVVLHPHPNFRMFLTVSPNNGEISRAMRNRGVEVFMMAPYGLVNHERGACDKELELKDIKTFIVQSAITMPKLVNSIAKAHIYARDEGLSINVHITYLELARWVQLFQQLLVKGNKPLWSLLISWKHTYLSSFGEDKGANIVHHAILAYLSQTELCDAHPSRAFSMPVLGMWSMPLGLRDFIWHSREASLRQKFKYLEYVISQYATHHQEATLNRCSQSVYSEVHLGPYSIDMKMLHEIFAKASKGAITKAAGKKEFELELFTKMLLFAANWIVEQATLQDLDLFKQHFKCYINQLNPFCSFFNSFLESFKREIKHPIWQNIIHHHQILTSSCNLDPNLYRIPLLSQQSVEFLASSDQSVMSHTAFCNAVNCIGPLRLTFQQWNTESLYAMSDENQHFQTIFESLQDVEKRVLNMLLDTASFDVLIQLYAELLENHVDFWRNFISRKHDQLLVSSSSLKKSAAKLIDFCPEAVPRFMSEIEKLQISEKSLLWVHGGHPGLPSSSQLYYKQNELLNLCERIWPTKPTSSKPVNGHTITSSRPELRHLAVEGICMSSHVIISCDDDDIRTQQLDEMRQILWERFEHEKSTLETNLGPDELAMVEAKSKHCGIFLPEILCCTSGFNAWQESLPLVDSASFFMDMQLLEKLSSRLLVETNEELNVCSLSKPLESALKFSLTYSSRPPQAFLPHQKLLWALDAWTSVDRVWTKFSSFVNEMWFRWHQALWYYLPVSVEDYSKISGYNIPSNMLMNPVKTATVVQILESPKAVRDYSIHCLRLRAVSSYLWQSSHIELESGDHLLFSARSLLQQIIYAHRKSFEGLSFDKIKSSICLLQSNAAMGGKDVINMQEDNIRQLCSQIMLSSHHGLRSSVNVVLDILRDLYCPENGFHNHLGFAWWKIGKLRLDLLTRDELDPALKYSCKYSLLAERISLLELEIKVRQDCDHLAGSFGNRSRDTRYAEVLKKLKAELKKLQRKLVFRPDQRKQFKILRRECTDFLEECQGFSLFSNEIAIDFQQLVNRVCNWQEKAACFINRLTDAYAAYVDITQPIQLAIYEMKLGSLLRLSSAFQNKISDRIGNMELMKKTVYSLMRFPRENLGMVNSIDVKNRVPEFLCYDIEHVNLLVKLVALSNDHSTDEKVSSLNKRISINLNILVRAVHFVADSQMMNVATFMLLDKLFDEDTSLWMECKEREKIKEDNNAQVYKFRPRKVKISNVFDDGIASLSKSFQNDSFLKWQELFSEDEFGKMDTEIEGQNLEEEWTSVEEANLNNVVHMHNLLFGSIDLIKSPGTFKISDEDRLLSFTESYRLGADILRGFWGLDSSSLDSKLIPEHLLSLCLEYEHISNGSKTKAHAYNFYQDSNAPAMAKMVELLTGLQQKLRPLAEEEDHSLKRIIDIAEMLLSIPLSSPLAKAFSGLQLLLNRIHMLQRERKLPLSNELEPVIALLISWQKLELDSWPGIFDEVQNQCNINASMLWFPLYKVLMHKHSVDTDECNLQSIILSLEEFLQTSSIGEFKRRLQMLLACLGQIDTGICLGTYSRHCHLKLRMVLYNIFGFYVQFLPLILHYIEINKKDIEVEVKELQKLSRWERFDSYSSLESSKKSRGKVQNLIQKFTVIMESSVKLVLDFETVQEGVKVQSPLDPEIIIQNVGMLKEQTELKDRSEWCMGWLENEALGKGSLSSQSAYRFYEENWKEMWGTLEMISSKCDVLSTHDSQGQLDRRMKEMMKRTFFDLRNQLKAWGLSRNKFEDQSESNQSSWWLLDSSHDIKHLLLTPSRLSCEATVASIPNKLICLDTEWRAANEYYFKSMASVERLRQISLKFKKDFSSEQVKGSVYSLTDLIHVQQKQRSTVYSLAKSSKYLRECVTSLENLYASCCTPIDDTTDVFSTAQNKPAILNCLWQQKQIFDSVSAMLHEESLLLKAVDGTHLSTRQHVKGEEKLFLDSISEFIEIFQRSKDSLNGHLLGLSGVVTTSSSSLHPRVVSRKMEQLVSTNFQVLKDFQKRLVAVQTESPDKNSIIGNLLSRFNIAFEKSKLLEEDFHFLLRAQIAPTNSCRETSCDIKILFDACLKSLENTMQNLRSSNSDLDSDEQSMLKIESWGSTFESHVKNLGIQQLCEILDSIFDMQNIVSYSAKDNLAFHLKKHYQELHASLELILKFTECLLRDFLALHKTVALMTHVLANVLASLFYRGFGREEEQVSEDGSNVPQDASGTGMGDGAGLNDISNEITDEDQLLGTTEKAENDQNNSDENQTNNEKGIEMEQDFTADAYSVSEESGEDENDDDDEDDEQLDNAMGEAGADSEVVDEKLWNKDEDNEPNRESEKNESGPSVKDMDPSSRELRAKEDLATGADEHEELGSGEPDKLNDEAGSQDDVDDSENVEDMNIDKEEASTDPTEMKPSDFGQNPEDEMEIDEKEDGALTEDGDSEELESEENAEHEKENGDSAESDESDEKTNGHETLEKIEPEGDNSNMDTAENADGSSLTEKDDALESEISNLTNNVFPSAENSRKEESTVQASSSKNFDTEVNWSNDSAVGSGIAPSKGLPSSNSHDTELAVTNSNENVISTDNQSRSQVPEHDSLAPQRTQPNPFRSVVDALEEWKERAKVSTDLHTDDMEAQDVAQDENAEEYGYVTEFEKGTAQALGPATDEQTERSLDGYKRDVDSSAQDRDESARTDIEEQTSDAPAVGSSNSFLKNKVEEKIQSSSLQKSLDDGTTEVIDRDHCDPESLSESLVSLKKAYLSGDIEQFQQLSVSDEKMRDVYNSEGTSFEFRKDATAIWRKYELLTTRLSQELAEQLRLVLEPTLASKLQGDYKTGKRINMKKVIPYIASHYRKDKIWLRRTRPNKRDYQVVIAVDDSRSMSESGCGSAAIEALVTVCRAMSQLEMGNLAVTSFGKKGNIKLLHDFDQPFGAEAGVKMISSLSFSQENSIADEPVVDLMNYLNCMLDAAVAKARLPSGQNPLEQLVLIIADGRFHEKDNLKRYVRNVLNKKRMVAFLLLDCPEESIVDLMEASFEGGNVKFSKYLDSFPFPYYIVLKNVQALPRTLADLLRQWFELMQHSRE